MNEHTTTQRTRPRWARVIHNFGDDIRWATSAWCDFPRPVRRMTAAVATTATAHAFGIDDAVTSIVSAITG